MLITLPDPLNEEFATGELEVGDYVHITVWETGDIRGQVAEITKNSILLHDANLEWELHKEGFDYSLFKKPELRLSLTEIAHIRKAF